MGSGAPPTLAEDAGLRVKPRPQALLRLVNQNGDPVGVRYLFFLFFFWGRGGTSPRESAR